MMDIHELTCDFFGLPLDSDGYQILGLINTELDANAVKRAMRRRYAQLLASPRASSEEAELVKKHLSSLGIELLHSASLLTPLVEDTRQKLTSLDHSIIAALIAGGGWNSKTRSRLVSIAGSYSLTVGGLMRILEALAEAAREGKGPLAIERRNEISINRTWSTIPPKKSNFSIAEEFIAEATSNFTPDFKSQNPLLTVILSIVFCSLTLFAFILVLSVLLSEDVKQNVPFVPEENITKSVEPVKSNNILFESYPTFQVDSINDSFIQQADQVLALPSLLAELQDTIWKTARSDTTQQSIWLSKWSEAIDVLSEGWAFADKALVRSLEIQIVQLIQTAEQFESFLLQMLVSIEMKPITTQDSFSPTQNIWTTGMLTRLACSQQVSLANRETFKRALLQLTHSCDPAKAKQLASSAITLDLASRTEFNSTYLNLWENWIQTLNATLLDEEATVAFLYAISTLLKEGIDVSRESNSRLVIGRLVKEIEWAKREVTRDAISEIYTSSEYSTADVQLLGLLLQGSNKASWFSSLYIVESDDSMPIRTEKATLLTSNWPSESKKKTMVWNLSIPDGFNEKLYSSWARAYESAMQLSSASPLVSARVRNVNEAAVYIWKGRPDLAFQTLDPNLHFKDEDLTTTLHLNIKNDDGQLRKSYANAGSSSDKQLEVIETLLGNEYSSLGEEDAATLASAALLNPYSRIRLAATELIISNFSNCPNVAIAIVDHIFKSKSNKEIGKLVANLTEAILPDEDDSDWLLQARRALVQHALTVENTNAKVLDYAAFQLANSYIDEYLLLMPTALPPSREVTPLEAITLVVDEWIRSSAPFEKTVSSYEFKSLGIMQSFLRQQIAYLQLLIISEAKWRGQDKLYTNAYALIAELGNATSIIEQVVFLEKAIAHHWHSILSTIEIERKNRLDNQ